MENKDLIEQKQTILQYKLIIFAIEKKEKLMKTENSNIPLLKAQQKLLKLQHKQLKTESELVANMQKIIEEQQKAITELLNRF